MPTVSVSLDYAGRPVIALYIGISAAAPAELFTARLAPTALSVRALVDTGASRTVVEERFVAELGLDATGEIPFRSATTGAHAVNGKLYAVSVASADSAAGILAPNLEIVAVEDLSAFEVQALLGRDILNSCVLLYNGPARTINLAFPPLEQP